MLTKFFINANSKKIKSYYDTKNYTLLLVWAKSIA